MKKDGFTLVEIMIVVGVVALLSLLGTYASRSGLENSRKKQAEVELQMLSTAILQLAWDTGCWPNKEPRNEGADRELWDLSGDVVGLMGTDGAFNNWRGPYYDDATIDPWGNPYFFDPDYRVDGVMRVAVGSFGPNGSGRNVYDSDNIYVLLDD